MKVYIALFIVFGSVLASIAQKPNEVLATANGRSFTRADLPNPAQGYWDNLPKIVAETRIRLFDKLFAERLLAAEAKKRGVSPTFLKSEAQTKSTPSTDAEVLSVYNANKGSLGDKTLEDVRMEIVQYLDALASEKKLQKYLDSIRSGHQVIIKDINTTSLKPIETVLSIDGMSVTAGEFDSMYKAQLYNASADIYEAIIGSTGDVILSYLAETEARSKNIDATTLIATEVTSKLREFTDAERLAAQNAFRSALFTKYNYKILLKVPDAPLIDVSVDDDPSQGSANAPVTVVMFTDFQCPACAETYPLLKKVIGEYPGKVRFVVRDYPLTSRHANAFQSAMAANAAFKQSKFWEYTPILYTHQDSLDKASLRQYATDLGLDLKRFDADIADPAAIAEIKKDIADGDRYGVSGTPTIYVNGVVVRDISAAGIKNAVDRALKK